MWNMRNFDLALLIKKFNLWLKRKIQPEVEATSAKLQAASNA